jgi:hypothetical protein
MSMPVLLSESAHLTNPRLHDVAHLDLMEVAKEVSANEYIEEPLPDPITWQAFERYGLRRGQSTRERYEKLVAARESSGLSGRTRCPAGRRTGWPESGHARVGG